MQCNWVEMDVEVVSQTGPDQQLKAKAALLAKASGVTRLVKLSCDKDPTWSLKLLQRAAPTVQRLSVYFALKTHLSVVHTMPRLTRLNVSGHFAQLGRPLELPSSLPLRPAGLQWLSVGVIARTTTQSLLRANGRTLEEVELWIGTAGNKCWPDSCGDLAWLLQQSGLRAIKRIVLRRYKRCSHEPAACSKQLAEVRRVLPSAEVKCGKCDYAREDEV
ncbi:uncharacterized protein LOC113205235 [Frankliniella occidentalis]|uniref:Uncharacterized protein LOC113205235 n=1 Tax=Frankliniella occidentalis TaxID=133901 RepID=A0A6J1SD43_FRAOC|nr:uncharacterized protein LOC113205235 [Frankliniella occidentalis]